MIERMCEKGENMCVREKEYFIERMCEEERMRERMSERLLS